MLLLMRKAELIISTMIVSDPTHIPMIAARGMLSVGFCVEESRVPFLPPTCADCNDVADEPSLTGGTSSIVTFFVVKGKNVSFATN